MWCVYQLDSGETSWWRYKDDAETLADELEQQGVSVTVEFFGW